MDFSLSPEDKAFLTEFRDYLDGLKAEGYYPEQPLVGPDHAVAEDDLAKRKAFIKRLGGDGWLGISWPKEYGGRGASGIQQWLMMDELAYRKLPAMLLGVVITGLGIVGEYVGRIYQHIRHRARFRIRAIHEKT